MSGTHSNVGLGCETLLCQIIYFYQTQYKWVKKEQIPSENRYLETDKPYGSSECPISIFSGVLIKQIGRKYHREVLIYIIIIRCAAEFETFEFLNKEFESFEFLFLEFVRPLFT